MKNYHVVGILLSALVILASAASYAGQRMVDLNTNCPFPSDDITAFIVTDGDGDGTPDHVFWVYTDGECAGQTVHPNDTGVPLAEIGM